MAISNRQNNLFAAEDWTVAYKAFSQVNFQAYDFDTLKDAMVEYIRTNFPENFNDYIESSEFIAIIELLAYLGQSLAFRMDVNTRENFLETAERRDSVFKLARQLGYTPKRNIGASGILKVESVSTSEPIDDSLGTNLQNTTVFWNDANNPDSYEQFITILNSAFSGLNRFTKPVKSGSVGSIATDMYQINTPFGVSQVYPFTLNVNGIRRSFEVVNASFEDNGKFFELHPDGSNNFQMFYRNDGLGTASEDTGFFMMFKQGTLQSADFNFEVPVENRVQDVSVSNINESDVYLQQIDITGSTLQKWTKVPNTVGQTLNYNNLSLETPTLYAVENLGNGGIRLRFGDGSFANVPVGTFRLWHRTSDPERFTVQPDDAQNITINIPYINRNSEQYILTVTLSLNNAIANSLPAESIDAIKERAPQQFYTQDRMVNSQDYQVLPLAKNPNIRKLKTINRTHAGHSRYIDINDPTGTFQSVENFANDGLVYKEDANQLASFIVDSSTTTTNIVSDYISNTLKMSQLNNFVYEDYRQEWERSQPGKFDLENYGIKWKTQPRAGRNDTGYMTQTYRNGFEEILLNSYPETTIIQEGHLLKAVNPNDPTDFKWVKIISIQNNGQPESNSSLATGPFALSEEVTEDWKITEIIVTLRKTFTSAETSTIVAALEQKQTFGLGYEPSDDRWYVITATNLNANGTFSVLNAERSNDSSWLLKFTYVPIDGSSYRYNMELRGLQYVFESYEDLRFYNITTSEVADTRSGQAERDTIEISSVNTRPTSTEIFRWDDSDNDTLGDAWYNGDLGVYYPPVAPITQAFDYIINLPLKTRNTSVNDVRIDFQTNFGLLPEGNSNVSGSFNYVNATTFRLETAISGNTAVSIPNNYGVIRNLPANITIAFDRNTFGGNIVSSTGNISYRAFEPTVGNAITFTGNVGTTTAVSNANLIGHITLVDYDSVEGTGNLAIRDFNVRRNFVADSSGLVSKDNMIITYFNDRSQLDKAIVWDIIDSFNYADGYVDARKVIVAPTNTTNDDAPDDPLQFSQFVSERDVLLFETYTDFDGYQYSRPVKSGILDLREEDSVTFDSNYTTITLDSDPSISYLTSEYEYYLVPNFSFIEFDPATRKFENNSGFLQNKKVFVADEFVLYQLTYSSTDTSVVRAYQTEEYYARKGRGFTQNTKANEIDDLVFKWDHIAPRDVRIDPSISNIMEMFMVTETYYNEITSYLNVPGTPFPAPPTASELETEFANLNQYKTASDQLIFRSGKFKLLFGDDAIPELRARFKIVKLPGTSLSDNEVKSQVLKAIKEYFDIDNWDFGETFYFTELSSYIHQQVGNAIGSIVIVPKGASSSFGDLFQVKANSDELFLSTATVDDIEIVDRLTSKVLRSAS